MREEILRGGIPDYEFAVFLRLMEIDPELAERCFEYMEPTVRFANRTDRDTAAVSWRSNRLENV